MLIARVMLWGALCATAILCVMGIAVAAADWYERQQQVTPAPVVAPETVPVENWKSGPTHWREWDDAPAC